MKVVLEPLGIGNDRLAEIVEGTVGSAAEF